MIKYVYDNHHFVLFVIGKIGSEFRYNLILKSYTVVNMKKR